MAASSPPETNLRKILEDSKLRWLRPAEVQYVLQNYKKQGLFVHREPINKPECGRFYLFDKKLCRFFRKDGHSWHKKRDGKTVKESHEKLKVGSVEVLHCYYATGGDNERLQRRSYWLLQDERVVLVHYLERAEGTGRSRGGNFDIPGMGSWSTEGGRDGDLSQVSGGIEIARPPDEGYMLYNSSSSSPLHGRRNEGELSSLCIAIDETNISDLDSDGDDDDLRLLGMSPTSMERVDLQNDADFISASTPGHLQNLPGTERYPLSLENRIDELTASTPAPAPVDSHWPAYGADMESHATGDGLAMRPLPSSPWSTVNTTPQDGRILHGQTMQEAGWSVDHLQVVGLQQNEEERRPPCPVGPACFDQYGFRTGAQDDQGAYLARAQLETPGWRDLMQGANVAAQGRQGLSLDERCDVHEGQHDGVQRTSHSSTNAVAATIPQAGGVFESMLPLLHPDDERFPLGSQNYNEPGLEGEGVALVATGQRLDGLGPSTVQKGMQENKAMGVDGGYVSLLCSAGTIDSQIEGYGNSLIDLRPSDEAEIFDEEVAFDGVAFDDEASPGQRNGHTNNSSFDSSDQEMHSNPVRLAHMAWRAHSESSDTDTVNAAAWQTQTGPTAAATATATSAFNISLPSVCQPDQQQKAQPSFSSTATYPFHLPDLQPQPEQQQQQQQQQQGQGQGQHYIPPSSQGSRTSGLEFEVENERLIFEGFDGLDDFGDSYRGHKVVVGPEARFRRNEGQTENGFGHDRAEQFKDSFMVEQDEEEDMVSQRDGNDVGKSDFVYHSIQEKGGQIHSPLASTASVDPGTVVPDCDIGGLIDSMQRLAVTTGVHDEIDRRLIHHLEKLKLTTAEDDEKEGCTTSVPSQRFGLKNANEEQHPLSHARLLPHHQHRFVIHEFAPRWVHTNDSGQATVLVVGQVMDTSVRSWFCKFGDVETKADLLINGTLLCKPPVQNKAAKVVFFITCGDGNCCSNAEWFEYRSPSAGIEDMARMGLLVRLVRTVLSDDVRESNLLSNQAVRTGSDRNPGPLGEWEWLQEGDWSLAYVQGQLLQMLIKRQLAQWLQKQCQVLASQRMNEAYSGVDNQLDDAGMSVVHIAAALGYEWAIAILKAAKANLDSTDIGGRTPLHWAAAFGRELTVATLLAGGATPGILLKDNWTAAELAEKRGHTAISGMISLRLLEESQAALFMNDSSVDILTRIQAQLGGPNAVDVASAVICRKDFDGQDLAEVEDAINRARQAAALIQAAYRRYYARKKKREHETRRASAARRIQKAYRGFLKMKTQRRTQAATKIQKVYRGWSKRKEYVQKRRKIIKLQAQWRCQSQRRRYVKMRKALVVIGAAVRHWHNRRYQLLQTQRLLADQEEEDKENLRSNRVGEKWRNVGGVHDPEAIERAVVKVQAIIRTRQAQKAYRRMRDEILAQTAQYDDAAAAAKASIHGWDQVQQGFHHQPAILFSSATYTNGHAQLL